MSKPTNSAARNAMTESERKCYDWGWEDAEDRIIKLLKEHAHPEAEAEYLIDCDLCERYYGVGLALALIEGEQN